MHERNAAATCVAFLVQTQYNEASGHAGHKREADTQPTTDCTV